eukprot:NODE_11801_length_1264_cov_6.569921.p1 GENE.NODE_11801_length_1264_cov_6.569921~~NODE_11801_length_1264_cov_6.569921.p1  ORF type:complete len:266 (+),score=49.68 NODE_11801_length_1264_cov_6.569921:269-1066(+)
MPRTPTTLRRWRKASCCWAPMTLWRRTMPLCACICGGLAARRFALLLAVLLLFGLLAEVVLRAALPRLAWPVRKVIFTMRGEQLGLLRFVIDGADAGRCGVACLDGDEEVLRRANQFWLSDEDWRTLWEEAGQLAKEGACHRAVRHVAVGGVALSMVVALAAVILAALGFRLGNSIACYGAIAGALLLLGIFAATAVRGLRATASAGRIERHLGERADCSAAWSDAESGEGQHLVLTVRQRPASAKPSTKIKSGIIAPPALGTLH